jgi:hypothetical protein
MKKPFYLFAITLGISAFVATNQSYSQTSCKSSLSKGQVIHYIRTDSPDPLMEVPNWPILKGKKKELAYEQFKADVASGKLKGKTYPFDMTISNVESRSNGSIVEFTFMSGTTAYKSYTVCSNDTLFGVRNKNGVPLMGDKNDTVGFMIMGISQYPMNLKVGDVLPAVTDLFYTFPEKVDASYKKTIIEYVLNHTNTWSDANYVYTQPVYDAYCREVTMKLNYTLQFSAPTVTYRHVVAEDEVTVNGKSYKAFKIELSMEAKMQDIISDVNADELLVKWSYDFTNKYIVNKVNKSEHLKHGGYEWFVPELGLITTMQIVNDSNDPLYTTHITGFN